MTKLWGVGFIATLLLVFVTYWVAVGSFFSKFVSDLVVAGLTALQAGLFALIYFAFDQEGRPYWSFMVFLFMLLVTFLLVVGSIWIMYHLNYNLMPHE